MPERPVILASCEAFPYALPLKAPLQTGGRILHARHGLIIRLGDREGYEGYGEVAPLPGLHREDLAAVLSQWRCLQPELIGRTVPGGLPELGGGFEDWLGGYDLWPSLRHGLETAVLNGLACARGITLAGLLAPGYPKLLPVNGLLVDGDSREQARQLALEGYPAVKLKVGRRAPEQDIVRVRAVRESLGEGIALRLDANRGWDLETALRFA